MFILKSILTQAGAVWQVESIAMRERDAKRLLKRRQATNDGSRRYGLFPANWAMRRHKSQIPAELAQCFMEMRAKTEAGFNNRAKLKSICRRLNRKSASNWRRKQKL